jgi:hypothetical protein
MLSSQTCLLLESKEFVVAYIEGDLQAVKDKGKIVPVLNQLSPTP